MNGVAFVCMIASGTLLPIMDLVFGQFVTVFNGFAIGEVSAEEFRVQINKYSCVAPCLLLLASCLSASSSV